MDTFTIANSLFEEQQQRDPEGFDVFLQQVAQFSAAAATSYQDASVPATNRYNIAAAAYGYLYKYSPLRSSIVRVALYGNWLPHLEAICSSGQTPSILVAGGGPGTEIIALGKVLDLVAYFKPSDYPVVCAGCKLQVHVYDSAPVWQPVLTDVSRLTNQYLNPSGFVVNVSSIALDLSSVLLQGPFPRGHDLLIVSYAFAEITSSRNGSFGSHNLVSLVKSLRPGAGVLLLESAQDGRGAQLDQFADYLVSEGLTADCMRKDQFQISQEHMEDFKFWLPIQGRGGHHSDYTTSWRLIYQFRTDIA